MFLLNKISALLSINHNFDAQSKRIMVLKKRKGIAKFMMGIIPGFGDTILFMHSSLITGLFGVLMPHSVKRNTIISSYSIRTQQKSKYCCTAKSLIIAKQEQVAGYEALLQRSILPIHPCHIGKIPSKLVQVFANQKQSNF